MYARLFLLGTITVLIGTGFFLYITYESEDTVYKAPPVEQPEIQKVEIPYKETTLLFVGDIMVGRNVELLMESEGSNYPFQYLNQFLGAPDLTVGNFEGVIPKVHVPTPSMGFQFSIKSETLPLLKSLGFDVLSFANNHSLDFGTSSLSYTRGLCHSLELVCVGSPKGIDDYSSTVIEVNDTKIGFLFVETILNVLDESLVQATLSELSGMSDIQIVYVHWGTEYALIHSSREERLAHLFIDSGADAVIGHHPHVIQDVELYNGKPIFYSLGNFIFDQYFSTEVQEELALEMRIGEASTTYTLVPFTSTSTRSQPNFMTETQKQGLFQRVFLTATQTPSIHIESGTIIVPKTDGVSTSDNL